MEKARFREQRQGIYCEQRDTANDRNHSHVH
jgi:hypothetical protein